MSLDEGKWRAQFDLLPLVSSVVEAVQIAEDPATVRAAVSLPCVTRPQVTGHCHPSSICAAYTYCLEGVRLQDFLSPRTHVLRAEARFASCMGGDLVAQHRLQLM